MRVRAEKNKFIPPPVEISEFGSPDTPSYITIGKEYEVFAIAVFGGLLSVQVINDVDSADWDPIWFFDIIDASLPSDWICKVFEGQLQMVLGPSFVASSEEAYTGMVEHVPEQEAAFWARAKPRNDDLED